MLHFYVNHFKTCRIINIIELLKEVGDDYCEKSEECNNIYESVNC